MLEAVRVLPHQELVQCGSLSFVANLSPADKDPSILLFSNSPLIPELTEPCVCGQYYVHPNFAQILASPEYKSTSSRETLACIESFPTCPFPHPAEVEADRDHFLNWKKIDRDQKRCQRHTWCRANRQRTNCRYIWRRKSQNKNDALKNLTGEMVDNFVWVGELGIIWPFCGEKFFWSAWRLLDVCPSV